MLHLRHTKYSKHAQPRFQPSNCFILQYSQTFSTFTQYMSVSHGHNTIGGIEWWLWRRQKGGRWSHINQAYQQAMEMPINRCQCERVGIAMRQMHQSYKCMKAQQKKLVGVHPTCLLTKTQGTLRKPIVGIYKPSSIMKISHQYMKVTK